MKRFIAKVTKFYKGGEKGFTLIELLIVIVILGVLAAAIIPNLSKFLGSGQVGAANAELASVRTGVAGYMSDHDGDYPVVDLDDQPVAADTTYGTAHEIVTDLLAPYVTIATFKGGYLVDFNGLIYCETDSYTDTRVQADPDDNLSWVDASTIP